MSEVAVDIRDLHKDFMLSHGATASLKTLLLWWKRRRKRRLRIRVWRPSNGAAKARVAVAAKLLS